MSIIQNIIEKQNSVFILIKKNHDPEYSNQEILGVYSSQDVALTEKQKYSIKYNMFQLKIEGPFIINKNLPLSIYPNPSPIFPDPLYVKPNLNTPSLPRFNPIYTSTTQTFIDNNSIF